MVDLSYILFICNFDLHGGVYVNIFRFRCFCVSFGESNGLVVDRLGFFIFIFYGTPYHVFGICFGSYVKRRLHSLALLWPEFPGSDYVTLLLGLKERKLNFFFLLRNGKILLYACCLGDKRFVYNESLRL